MRTISTFMLLLSGTPLGAEAKPWVIDGDTVVIAREHIRIANLDAPDIGKHARCALEAERGHIAKDMAIKIIRDAKTIQIYARTGRDRYGRSLARLSIDGSDFGEQMISAGQARPWRGRSSNWCQN
jgi:micrococcal nuclease